MLHARKDYNRIQDPENLIPQDEPVMIFRGQDVCAPAALDAWCKEAKKYGVDEKMIEVVAKHATLMRCWQIEHNRKVPDMPLD